MYVYIYIYIYIFIYLDLSGRIGKSKTNFSPFLELDRSNFWLKLCERP